MTISSNQTAQSKELYERVGGRLEARLGINIPQAFFVPAIDDNRGAIQHAVGVRATTANQVLELLPVLRSGILQNNQPNASVSNMNT